MMYFLYYILFFYSIVYKVIDIDEVVVDLYMDSFENLFIVFDLGFFFEIVVLFNNQVNDRQRVRLEREIELFIEVYICFCFRIEKIYILIFVCFFKVLMILNIQYLVMFSSFFEE